LGHKELVELSKKRVRGIIRTSSEKLCVGGGWGGGWGCEGRGQKETQHLKKTCVSYRELVEGGRGKSLERFRGGPPPSMMHYPEENKNRRLL